MAAATTVEFGLPLFTVIDTGAAALSKEAEEGGLWPAKSPGPCTTSSE